MQQESGGNTRAVSPKGARGAFQFMPATAKQYGVNVDDLTSSATGAAKMYSDLLKQSGGDLSKALAGYNWGQGNVQRKGMDNMPAETKNYIQKVTANMKPQANDPREELIALRRMAELEDKAAQPQVAQQKQPADKSGTFLQGVGNLAAGAVRGAGSIGATILAPVDAAARAMGVQNDFIGRTDRRAAMDGGLQSMGAQPDSMMYQGGKLAGEIAGTAGAGGVLANGVRAVSTAPRAAAFANALQTGGFRTGLPAATTKAGMAGQMGLRSLAGATTGGAATAMINPDLGSIKTGAAVGGVLPPALAGVGKIAHATGNALRGSGVTPEVQALAARANELGINIPADRIANSRPMNALASSLNYVPFSGRAATEKNMTSQLTRAASKLIGQDSDNMAIALRKASDDLGSKFDITLKSNAVKLDDSLLKDIVDIDDIARQQLGGSDYKAISSQVAELLKKGESGAIDGQAAYNIKRTLDRMGRTNSPSAFHALELKKVLMSGLDRSLGPEKAAAFAKTREQYGNMLDLEKIVLNGAEGDISIARLAGMKNINNKPLQEIADITAQFVKTRESQHGAMQRVGAGLGLGTMAGPAWLMGGAVAGAGTNKLLNSGAARDFVMKRPGGDQVNRLANRVGPALYRSAPVLAADR